MKQNYLNTVLRTDIFKPGVSGMKLQEIPKNIMTFIPLCFTIIKKEFTSPPSKLFQHLIPIGQIISTGTVSFRLLGFTKYKQIPVIFIRVTKSMTKLYFY
jgi:hypothetical protein